MPVNVIFTKQRNAALQLFGGLVPRIVGQKKIRCEDSIYNSITVDEFFTRYPTLPEFLLTKLSQNSDTLVHPSLVPLLVLFSRLSLGPFQHLDKTDDLIKRFKLAFKGTFSSCVVNVRKLASKAYVNFTSKDELINEVQNTCLEVLCGTLKHNYVDACLSCIHEMLKMLKTEYLEIFSANYQRIVSAVKDLSYLDERNCYVKLNVLKIWKWIDFSENELSNLKYKLMACKNYSNIHPGYKELIFEMGKEQKECSPTDYNLKFESRESCLQYLTLLKTSDLESDDICRKVQLLLEENIHSSIMTGKIFEECNRIIIVHRKTVLNDPELSMDILELSNGNDVSQQHRYGVMAATTSLMVQAICFASMMTQPDFKMFFSDESVYVSLFSKMTEDLENYSQPSKMETCRMHSAQSLKYLIPVFNTRDIRADFDPLIMYAFVKLANTALILLNDEDNQVREMITEFVSELNTNVPYPRNVSSLVACEKLILYGLEHFSSCIEWFMPIEEVFFHPWTSHAKSSNKEYAVQILRNVGVREYLFESGDGINVYIEEVGLNMLFSEIIRKWLLGNTIDHLPFKLNLNIGNIIEQVTSLIEYVENNSNVKDYSGELWNNQGFLLLIRYYNLLRIIKDIPFVINTESHGGDSETKKLLAGCVNYVEEHFPHFINN